MIEAFFAVSRNNKLADKDIGSSIFANYTNKNLNDYRILKRDCADAILVGANTIIIDNPTLLNTKRTNIRIIIDKYNNIPLTSKIFQIYPEKTYILTFKENNEYLNKLRQLGVNILKIENKNDYDIIRIIKSLSINNLLIEGGAHILNFFTKLKLVDKYTIVKFPFDLPEDCIGFNTDILKGLKKYFYFFDNIYEIYTYTV